MDSLQARVVRNARRRGVHVRTRRQWGSQFPEVYRARQRLTAEGHWGPFRERADTLVQHITVTRDDGPLTGDFDRDMREVERIGWDRFRSGFSYNAGIDPTTGMVGMGMPLLAKGTHTVNDKHRPGYSYDQNMVARAIAWVGMPGMKPTKQAQEALAQFIAALMDEGAITEAPDYLPHSFFAAKDCPTDNARAIMPATLERAKRLHRKAS